MRGQGREVGRPATLAPPFADLSPLSRRRLAAMRRAGRDLFDVLESCARKGGHPVSDVLAASPAGFSRWDQHPAECVTDARTGSGWFYHAHDPSEARPWTEHGHFHCFASAERLPKNAKALALPKNRDPDKPATVHLAAISIESSGVPKRLFATNRWVTGESLYRAREVVPLVERFAIRSDRRFELTSRWLSAMLRLCQPQVAWLLRERDRVIGERRARGRRDFTDDQAVEILAVADIDVDAHLAALDKAWKAKSRSGMR